MNRTLLTQALIKFLAGILLIGLLVFLPAGSFAYWQGWLLMVVLFIPMFFAGIVMLAKNPDLLRKRLNAKEKEGEQKAVVALSGLLFTLSFVTAGLNWRFDWWMLPDWTVWTAAALFVLSYYMRKYCGKTSTSPEPSKSRKNRKSLTPGYMALCVIRCICQQSLCSYLCHWFSVPRYHS